MGRNHVSFILVSPLPHMPALLSLGEQVTLGKYSQILNGGMMMRLTALLPCISNVHHDFKALTPLHFHSSPNLVLTHRAVFNKLAVSWTSVSPPVSDLQSSLSHRSCRSECFLFEECVWEGALHMQRTSLFCTSCPWALQPIAWPDGDSYRRAQARG